MQSTGPARASASGRCFRTRRARRKWISRLPSARSSPRPRPALWSARRHRGDGAIAWTTISTAQSDPVLSVL